jgi:exo-beta-1,3-glucanase (GH17 family)
MRVVVAEDYNVMVNGEELIGTSEYLMLQTR